MKNSTEAAVRHWLSVASEYKYETADFRAVIGEMSDDYLTDIKPVSTWFLDFAPFMFKVVHPKQHGELRTMIAYLNELRERQSEAWERKQNDYSTRLENVRSWVRQHTTSN